MNKVLRSAAVGVALAMGLAGASAQVFDTNVIYCSLGLEVALTGSTNGPVRTNGINAIYSAPGVRITSKDVIRALYNQPVLQIGKIVTTNLPLGTVITASPTFTPVTNSSYSSAARLYYLQPLGANNLTPPLTVIRDGKPAVDYVITNYFQVKDVSFNGTANPAVASGRYDFVHRVNATTESLIKGFAFNPSATAPPLATYFDVQGLARQSRSSVILNRTNLLTSNTIKTFSASVAGTGQIASTNGFCVLRGTVSANGGKVWSVR